MRDQRPADHLDLWRGIDDAVWREALRGSRAAPALVPLLGGGRQGEERRAAQPAMPRVPEPV